MITETFAFAVKNRPYLEALRRLTGRDTPQEVVRDALDISAYVGGRLAVDGDRVYMSGRMTRSDEWGRKIPDLARERAMAVELESRELARLKPVQRIPGLGCKDFDFSTEMHGNVMSCLHSFFGTYNSARLFTHAVGLHQRFAEAVIVEDRKLLIGYGKAVAEPLPFKVYENARRLAGRRGTVVIPYSVN